MKLGKTKDVVIKTSNIWFVIEYFISKILRICESQTKLTNSKKKFKKYLKKLKKI